MAKHITALVLLLAAVSFFFLAPGEKREALPEASGGGKGTVSAPKNPEENSSKIDKIKEDNKVLAEDSEEDIPEETTAE